MKELISRIKKFNSITRNIILLFVINLFIILILIVSGAKSNHYSFFSQLHNDSWDPMVYAVKVFREMPESSLYQVVFFKQGVEFQYPPSGLLIYDIPQRITDCSYDSISRVLDVISWISIVFTGLISAKILLLLLHNSKYQLTSKVEIWTIHILIVLLTFLYYPIRTSFTFGQIQTLLTFFATLSFFLFIKNKQILTGICIGLICIIKPHWGLIILWAAVRKKWKIVIAFSLFILCVGLISLALYGFNNHLDYLSVLSHISKFGKSYYPNQSINGFVNRLLLNGDPLADEFPPFSKTVYFITFISSILLFISGLLWKYKKERNNIIEFALMFLSITIASPETWIYHYGILFPIGFILIASIKLNFPNNKKLYVFTLILLVISGHYLFNFSNFFAYTKLNILQSYLLFCALGFLFVLYKVSIKGGNLSINNKSD